MHGDEIAPELAQAIALWHRDEVMEQYAATWNNEHIVFWARCRLVRMVYQDTELPHPTPDGPTAEDMNRFREVRWYTMIASRSPYTTHALRQYFEDGNWKAVTKLGNAIRREMGLFPLQEPRYPRTLKYWSRYGL